MKSTSYRIGEMADYLGISKEMIRYYEKCGVIHPQRLKDNNYRTYSSMDLFMLSEMLQLKEWGISVRDIAAMKNHQYTETVLACYKKALDSLNSDISLLELRKMRLSSLIDEIQTCTMNVGNYWVEQRHEGFWIEVGEGQGDEYSSLATPMEMRKWLYDPRNIVFWDSMCFLNETGTIWGSFLDSRYAQELGELVEKENPDAVILTTGATPLMPPIKGIDGKNVVTAEEVLVGDVDIPSGPVVVCGGGEVGCETAEFIAHLNPDVTVLEMKDAILNDMVVFTKAGLLELMQNAKIKILTGAKVSKIAEDSVTFEDREGKMQTVPATMVVSAFGYRSRNVLEKQLEGREVIVAGGAVKAGNAVAAFREGYEAGCRV